MTHWCLCLHGTRQTADIFRHQLSTLESCLRQPPPHSPTAPASSIEGLRIELDFLDAPHEMPQCDAKDAVAGRSWCGSASRQQEELGLLASGSEGTEEWDFTEGDRLVDEKLCEKPYTFLLGFSQGGLMLARCVARHGGRIPTGPRGEAEEEKSYVKGLIFIGSPSLHSYYMPVSPTDESKQMNGADILARTTRSESWVGPHEASIRAYLTAHPGGYLFAPSLPGAGQKPFLSDTFPSLHVLGEKDKIVEPRDSLAFHAACGASAQLLRHRHAHCVPQTKQATQAMTAFCWSVVLDESGGIVKRGKKLLNAAEKSSAAVSSIKAKREAKTRANAGAAERQRKKQQRMEEEAAYGEELDEALVQARENELEMIRALYGPEAVMTHQTEEEEGESHRQYTQQPQVIRLPLFGEDIWEDQSIHPLVRRWLSKLCVELLLPPLYPLEAPQMTIRLFAFRTTGVGSSSGADGHAAEDPPHQSLLPPRCVPLGKWMGHVSAALRAYQSENVPLESEMLLPLVMHATSLASESQAQLCQWLDAAREGRRVGVEDDGSASDPTPQQIIEPGGCESEKKKKSERLQQRLEEVDLEDAVRQQRAETADAEAVAILSGSTQGGAAFSLQQLLLCEEAKSSAAAALKASGSGGGRGSWKLKLGLIGKPSAGKSTFFNAITDPESEAEAARVAAFPFTTIEPNTGTGYAPLYCPCMAVCHCHGASQPHTQSYVECRAATYGHVRALGCRCHRRHPITVKDVAGLVKGAYQGRGKGNQFLNDVRDADVLVHVVDGAGATEADGTSCPEGTGSALEDISWVRAEVHFWMYDNLVAKWMGIVRQPQKLLNMFSGYGSNPAFVEQVLTQLGVHISASTGEKSLPECLQRWGSAEVHRLVALYIRLRFPIVVALNKADLSTAACVAQQLRERFPSEVLVPMAARVEWDLLQLRKQAKVRYVSGEASFEVTAAGLSEVEGAGRKAKRKTGADAESKSEEQKEDSAAQKILRAKRFFESLEHTPHHHHVDPQPPSSCQGSPLLPTPSQAATSSTMPDRPLTSTGVQDVLAMALGSCPMTIVFPVTDFSPFFPGLSAGSSNARSATSLCGTVWDIPQSLCFACGTSVEKVFGSLERSGAVDGKLVRFEAVEVKQLHRPWRVWQGKKAVEGSEAAKRETSLHSVPTVTPSVLRKTDVLPLGGVLVRVLTNKRQAVPAGHSNS